MYLHDSINFEGIKRFTSKKKNFWFAVVAFTLVFNMFLVGLIIYDKFASQPKKYKASNQWGILKCQKSCLVL